MPESSPDHILNHLTGSQTLMTKFFSPRGTSWTFTKMQNPFFFFSISTFEFNAV